MPSYCTHCGSALAPANAFCPTCGQPATPGPPQAVPPDAPPHPPPGVPQAPYGQPPPQAPYGQQVPGQMPAPGGGPTPNAPTLSQQLQGLPFLASLPVGLRLPALGAAALLAVLLLAHVPLHGNTAGPGQPVTQPGGGNSPSAQAGTFQGRCTTEAGNPLADVDVRIAGVTGAGENTVTEVHTDANGAYSQSLPPGKYSILNAVYPVTVGGTSYVLPLTVPDGANNDGADIGQGVVRDLVLHIHGKLEAPAAPEAWQAYYGGSLLFYVFGRYQIPQFPDGSITEVTLTPEGPLADGSTGQTLALRNVNHVTSAGTFEFDDIPIGPYTMTARLLNPDGTLLEPLTISTTGAAGNDPSAYKPSVTGLVFPADTATAQYPLGTVSGVSIFQMSLNDGG